MVESLRGCLDSHVEVAKCVYVLSMNINLSCFEGSEMALLVWRVGAL